MQSATTVTARNPIPLYSLFIANAISLVGNVFSLIAIPWFVLQTTGSATRTGITGFFTIMPVVLAGFLGGTLIDRLGYKRRVPRQATFVAAFVLTGLRFWVYAIYPSLAVLITTTFFCSIGAGPLNQIIGAVEFERIPANMRGRVFGAITAGAWIAMPLGMLLGGIFTDRFGTFVMMIGLAITFFITTLSMAFIPAMKEMNRKTY